MAGHTGNPNIASALFAATLAATIVGIFLSAYFFFVDPGFAYRVAALVLVGVVGIMSFVRHSVFYRSDQARMGWSQDHPEFQLEVGYANLAVGIVAVLVAGLNWGSFACGIILLIYSLYLLCTFLLHMYEAIYVKDIRGRAAKSAGYNAIFVIVLFVFAFLALSGTR